MIVAPGLMQEWSLTCDRILDAAALRHPRREVVTRSASGALRRTDYGRIHAEARRISAALIAAGISVGDRVATLAWNTEQHLATWYGVLGIGAVYHTLNPRLHPDQIAWIADHAGDVALFADAGFASLLDQIMPRLPNLRTLVTLDGAITRGNISGAVEVTDYPTFINAGTAADVRWGMFPESAACGLCYTSGTTGDPKGVVYSHRSNLLHALIAAQPTGLGIREEDVVLPVVPMFHANAWGLGFVCPMLGAKLVLPGRQLDGASLLDLIHREAVTYAAGVPTVWRGLLEHVNAVGANLRPLRRVLVGGSAVPPAMIDAFEQHGIEVIHAWGMTELSPLGTIGGLSPELLGAPPELRRASVAKQGRPPFGVELRLAAPDGADVAWDGQAMGRLLVRGPAVAAAYERGAYGDALDAEGWFDTGDIATIDAHGYMAIADRAKDVIKSGGEWISSIDLENQACAHPAVLSAAAIAMEHERWGERPRLVVQLRPGAAATGAEIVSFLEGKVAKWWLPDRVDFVDGLPLGPTGKVDKKVLRATLS